MPHGGVTEALEVVHIRVCEIYEPKNPIPHIHPEAVILVRDDIDRLQGFLQQRMLILAIWSALLLFGRAVLI
jgi:hypothetical protein